MYVIVRHHEITGKNEVISDIYDEEWAKTIFEFWNHSYPQESTSIRIYQLVEI